jgi:cytochrome c oxidase subunit IV
MNYVNFIVKIIGKPEQSFFKDDICITEVIVKVSQNKKTQHEIPFRLSIWGNLGYDVMQYYQINDYIIIEGYLSLRENIFDNSRLKKKQLEVSVFKIYPFLLKNVAITRNEK